jgi:endonuclease/exonuclease/phosphatase family metal-dependent hydrolase
MTLKIFSTSCNGMMSFVILIVFVVGSVAVAGPPGDESVDSTVMSFNIRYGAADDGDNSWPYRRDLVFQTIAGHEPAIFGVQECLWQQGEELQAAFPDYQMIGVGRDDGQQAGEMCAIFSRSNRYQVLDRGTFWLSESPEVVGSRGWDAALPRIATWVRLHDGWGVPDTLFVFNAHFDHVGKIAREKSAALLRTRMAKIAGDHPVILMGDFNDPAIPASATYEALLSDCGMQDLVLNDTWFLASREQRLLGEDTFHGFTGEPSRGRIDWILVTDHFQGIDAGIERMNDDGRYPSDHFPVWAEFRTPLKERADGQGN